MRFAARLDAIDRRRDQIEIVRERRQPEQHLIEADDGDAIGRPEQRLRELLRRGFHNRHFLNHAFGVIDEQNHVQWLVGRWNECLDFARFAIVEQRQLFALRPAIASSYRQRNLLQRDVDARARIRTEKKHIVRVLSRPGMNHDARIYGVWKF